LQVDSLNNFWSYASSIVIPFFRMSHPQIEQVPGAFFRQILFYRYLVYENILLANQAPNPTPTPTAKPSGPHAIPPIVAHPPIAASPNPLP
jgi:hypothetical protein